MTTERTFVTREIQEYPPILQAKHVMEITGFSNGKTYELLRSKDCPTIKHGNRMIVPRDLFWQFLLNQALGETANQPRLAV